MTRQLMSRLYMSLDAGPDRLADHRWCQRVLAALERVLEERYLGLIIQTFRTAEEIDGTIEYDASAILGATGGRLPVFIVNVTFDPKEASREDLAEIERDFHLVLLNEITGAP